MGREFGARLGLIAFFTVVLRGLIGMQSAEGALGLAVIALFACRLPQKPC